jgi:hypothetical protein
MVRSHLSEEMRLATLHHTKVVEQLAALRAAVSSTVEFGLGRSPTEAFRAEVMEELITEFWEWEE